MTEEGGGVGVLYVGIFGNSSGSCFGWPHDLDGIARYYQNMLTPRGKNSPTGPTGSMKTSSNASSMVGKAPPGLQ